MADPCPTPLPTSVAPTAPTPSPAHHAKASAARVSPESFTCLKLLGKGDVGRVYLVNYKPDPTKLYAMKVLNKREMIKRNKARRVMTEREILATIDHPFIVTLHWCFQSDDSLYFIMDFCAGGEFFRTLQRQPNKRLSEEAAKFYAAEVLLALEYLHLQGFVYRDLKPENILIQASGHIMLTDFDLCKQAPAGKPNEPSLIRRFFGSKPEISSKPEVSTTSFVGTEEYLAPEVIDGTPHGSAVDWWTFGVLIFEMVYGHTPFRGPAREDTFANILSSELRFPDRDPPLTKDCVAIITKLLNIEPKKRLGSQHGASDVKGHKWFSNIKWALIRDKTPPIIPYVESPDDTRNFRKYDEEIHDMHGRTISAAELAEQPNNPFSSFTPLSRAEGASSATSTPPDAVTASPSASSPTSPSASAAALPAGASAAAVAALASASGGGGGSSSSLSGSSPGITVTITAPLSETQLSKSHDSDEQKK